MRYLLPEEGRQSMLVRDIPKHGKIMLTKARASKLWQSRRAAYLQRAAVEAEHGDELLDAHWDGVALKESLARAQAEGTPTSCDISHEKRCAMYRLFHQNAKRWHGLFRKKCSEELQQALVAGLTLDTVSLKTEGSVELGKLYRETLALCSVDGAKELQNGVVEVLRTWQQQSSNDKVQSAATDFCQNPEPALVKRFAEAVRFSLDIVWDSEAGQQIQNALEASFDGAAKCTSGPSQWTDICSLWKFIADKPSAPSDFKFRCFSWYNLAQPLERFAVASSVYKESASQLVDGKVNLPTITGPWARLKIAYRAVLAQTTTHHGNQLEQATGTHAGELVESEQPTAAPSDGQEQTSAQSSEAWTAMLATLPKWHAEAKGWMMEAAMQVTALHEQRLREAVHFLKQVSGGAAGGSQWYNTSSGSSNEPIGDLMALFKKTLKNVDENQISALKKELQQAIPWQSNNP